MTWASDRDAVERDLDRIERARRIARSPSGVDPATEPQPEPQPEPPPGPPSLIERASE